MDGFIDYKHRHEHIQRRRKFLQSINQLIAERTHEIHCHGPSPYDSTDLRYLDAILKWLHCLEADTCTMNRQLQEDYRDILLSVWKRPFYSLSDPRITN